MCQFYLSITSLISILFCELGAAANVDKLYEHLEAYLRINFVKLVDKCSSWVPYVCFITTVQIESEYTPDELIFENRQSLTD